VTDAQPEEEEIPQFTYSITLACSSDLAPTVDSDTEDGQPAPDAWENTIRAIAAALKETGVELHAAELAMGVGIWQFDEDNDLVGAVRLELAELAPGTVD
jgi:hypothetical protein